MRGGELRKVEMLKIIIKNRRGEKLEIFPQIKGNSEVIVAKSKQISKEKISSFCDKSANV
jgi:hypothetical protein